MKEQRHRSIVKDMDLTVEEEEEWIRVCRERGGKKKRGLEKSGWQDTQSTS